MRYRSIGVLIAAIFLTVTATAQEQQGSIEGVLTDTSGGILPGVTVEAKNTELGTVVTSYSDGSGTYRFPALRPGTYEVTATLQGFVPAKVEDITLRLGQLLKVDMALKVGGVAEEIEVSAAAPIIDVKRSASAMSIRDELIDKLPKGRNFTSVVSQSASANDESKLAGISIDGASGAENRYVIDGIDTTDIQTGRSGKNIITDFIDEVQVKSSGYAAEYGGATGGVINVITKSGGNDWSGSMGMYLRTDNTNGDRRPTLRLDTDDSGNDFAFYDQFDNDDFTRVEPGFALGGPLLTDRAWFFGSYQPDIRTLHRTIDFGDQVKTFPRKLRTHYATANVHAQMTSNLRGRIAANLSTQTEDGNLPALEGTDNPDADFGQSFLRPDWTVSGNLDFTATNNLYFGFRGGHYFYNAEESGVPDEFFQICGRSNSVFNPPPGQECATFESNIASNFATTRDKFTRTGANVDGTYFGSVGGEHAIKGGVQYDRITNNVLDGRLQPRTVFWFDRTRNTLDGRSVRGTYGYYYVDSFQTTGDVTSNNTGLFVQDSWTVNDKLTINLGVRTEQETVPSFRTDLGQAENAIDFGFGDKLAPRIGFAYDMMGDGNWKVYGSWGVFYDITKLEMPRGLFGGDQWLRFYFTLEGLDWLNLGMVDDCHLTPEEVAQGVQPQCDPGSQFIEMVDFRHPANDPNDPTIDPNLDPMKSQEFTIGLQHRLNETMSVGFRYVHKQLDKTIEDVGVVMPGAEVFFISNPGFGIAEFTVADECPTCPAQPPATRDYDGLEFEFTKRMSDNWSVHASYLWSRLHGNYSGLASSDENGRSSPNVNRFFDSIVMSFDGNGQPLFGPLGTDRPHQFKLQGIYDFDFGTTIGLNLGVASGTPISRQVNVQSSTPVFYLGRESDGRTPTLVSTDLFLQHEFRLGGRRALQLSVNISNLFDSDTETTIFNTELQTTVPIANLEEFFAGLDLAGKRADPNLGLLDDPRFLMASGFQSPREIRFGIKYLF